MSNDSGSSAAVLDIPVRRIDGAGTSLGAYRGKVLLVVNVASQCGFTPQYAGLEALFERYRDQGLMVLGFPANEYGAQEPGSNGEIAQFCETQFGVQFPMFEKIVVKGEHRHPLYSALAAAQPQARAPEGSNLRSRLEPYGALKDLRDDDVLWNFEKFVIGRNGEVVARFSSDVAPDDPMLVQTLEAELAKPA